MREQEPERTEISEKLFFPSILSIIGIASFILYLELISRGSDITTHITWANQYFDGTLTRVYPSLYPAFYWLYRVFNSVFHVPDNYAGAYASTVYSLLCAIAIYIVISAVFRNKRYITEKTKSMIVLFMMFFGPVYLPGFNGSRYYLGQGTFNTWHNPTNNSVRFLTVVIFFLYLYRFFYMKEAKAVCLYNRKIYWWQIDIILGILIWISLWFKPSFFQVFAPTMGICILFDVVKNGLTRNGIKRLLQAMFVFIPGTLWMLHQARVIFFSGEAQMEMEIAPFDVWGHYSSNIPLSILCAVSFPIYVVLFCRSNSKQKSILNTSIVLYCVSCMEFALFAVAGSGKYAADFMWGMNLSIGIVFLGAMIEFIQYIYESKNSVRININVFFGFLLLSLHFFWGVWYYLMLNAGGPQCF